MLKSDHINGAYDRLRISGITVLPSPENISKALGRLESMMADLDIKGLCIDYVFEENPDANTESGVGREHEEMVASNLAIRLIPDFNKQVPVQLEKIASAAYGNSLGLVMAQTVRGVDPSPRMPLGSGVSDRWYRYRRFNPVNDEAPNVCATNSMRKGEIEDFTESFTDYLNDQALETVSSFSVVADSGVTVVSSSEASGVISYRIQADTEGGAIVTISVTTSTGRITNRNIHFQVSE